MPCQDAIKQNPHHSPPASFPQSEKAAPIIGPMRKPREKATPIIAMPLPLFEGVETSVTIAVDSETFPAALYEMNIQERLCDQPFEIPPRIRAKTNIVKLEEKTQSK